MDSTTPSAELVDAHATTAAVVAGVVPVAELAAFFDSSFTRIAAVTAQQGVAITGPAYARYHGAPAETADLEVGFPTAGTVADDGEVRAGGLPAGRAARLVHVGGYDTLAESWGRLARWIKEQGLTAGTDLWEVYVTEPTPEMDPATLRTELYWLVS